MSSRGILELQQGLRSAKDEVFSAIAEITEFEGHEVPAEGEWTVVQLLAHIAEIQVFWTNKAVLITEGGDPQIRRSDVENDRRLAAVNQGAQESLEESTKKVTAACEEAVATVGRMHPHKLGLPGHREENPMTAGGVVEYVARHVRDHANQITEARRLIRQKS